MRQPKYLANMDVIQDAIAEVGFDGITMRELADKTNLTYRAVQNATVRLRNRSRINYDYQGRTIRFYPTR